MTAEQCRLFEDCLAPLCPLDRSSLKGIWYSDEEICRSRTYGNLPWIRAQRKIARVKAGGYFTPEMLGDIRTARRGMTGLDPNEDEQTQLKRWFGLHEKKRYGHRRSNGENPSAKVPAKGNQSDLFSRSSACPETGIPALLQNVTKQGHRGKKVCRNRGCKRPRRKGTAKPPSRNGYALEPPFSREEKNDG